MANQYSPRINPNRTPFYRSIESYFGAPIIGLRFNSYNSSYFLCSARGAEYWTPYDDAMVISNHTGGYTFLEFEPERPVEDSMRMWGVSGNGGGVTTASGTQFTTIVKDSVPKLKEEPDKPNAHRKMRLHKVLKNKQIKK